MTDQPEDDRMDHLLRSLSADYNQPPNTVPREAMWSAIQQARAETAGADTQKTKVFPLRRRHWIPVAAGLAATLLIGVAIGRYSSPSDTTPTGTASSATTAPAVGGTGLGAEARRSVDVAGTTADRPYEVATLQHLGRVEALLTSFRAEPAGARGDEQVAAWARELLLSTRLLLDSPAGSDAQRRRLLEDLELVLVQIVQLTPDKGREERSLIERSIEKDDMLTRLRSAIPAGAVLNAT